MTLHDFEETFITVSALNVCDEGASRTAIVSTEHLNRVLPVC